MKIAKIAKIAFFLISLAFASQAFAQCGGMNLKFLGSDGSFHCSPEEARASDRARANLYGGNVTGTTFFQRAPVYQQPVILQAMPQGHAYRACTPEEVLKRDGLMMLRGAVAGLLIGDNSRSAGVGAGAGLLFSMTGSCRVAVPVSKTTLANQGIVGIRPATANVPSSCSINGNPNLQNLQGLTREQCVEIQKSQAASVPATTIAVAVGPETDENWQWRETLSVTSPGRCVVEKILEGVKNPPFCASIRSLPRNPGEGRKDWVLRAAIP